MPPFCAQGANVRAMPTGTSWGAVRCSLCQVQARRQEGGTLTEWMCRLPTWHRMCKAEPS